MQLYAVRFWREGVRQVTRTYPVGAMECSCDLVTSNEMSLSLPGSLLIIFATVNLLS